MARELEGASDKEYYAKSVHYLSQEHEAEFNTHMMEIHRYLDSVFSKIVALDRDFGPLNILELGAGTCLTSLLIKKRLGRGNFTCADISEERMAKLAGDVAKKVGTDLDNIRFVEADFTFALPFADNTFDLVFFDGALHHSRNIWTTLKECKRIVRGSGVVAALREAYLSRLTYGYAIKRLLNSPEFEAGVAENAYLKDQYRYYFLACGLTPEFLPVFSNWKWKMLSFLNGLAISKYNIWAKPGAK